MRVRVKKGRDWETGTGFPGCVLWKEARLNSGKDSDRSSLLKKGKYLLSLVGLCILYLVIRKAGWGNITEILSTMHPVFLCLAILAWILNLVLGTLRFKRFLATDLKFLELFEIYLFGSLMNYAAGIQGLGMGARVGMLRAKKVSVSRSSAGAGSEIICDIVLSAVIAIAGLTIYGKKIIEDHLSELGLSFFVLPAILGVVVLATMYFLRRKRFFKDFTSNIRRSFSSKILLGNVLVSLGMYTAAVTVVFCLYKAAGHSINPFLLLFAARLGYLLGLMSLIPGGLGVRDAVNGYVCSLAGIPLSITFSVSIITRFVCLMTTVTVLFVIGLSRKLLKSLRCRRA